MGRRSARLLGPVLIFPILLCVLLAVFIWILQPEPTTDAAATSMLPVVQSGATAEPTAPPQSGVASQPVASSGASAASAEQQRIAVYERVAPAVVSINTSSEEIDETTDLSTLDQALGSGFLYSSDGYIVTNNHVVEAVGSGATVEYAKNIEVVFANRKRTQATLVGADPDSDLAVIKVDPAFVEGIEPLKIADSSALKVGQDTIAIGNPFGLKNTMTTGIISALEGRSLEGRNLGTGQFRNTRIIQTDAAINPGNSGGPLLNSSGQLIGVNTAIRVSPGTLTPAFEGIGLAVPSNTVKAVVPDLIKYGKHKYAYLGIGLTEVSPTLAERYDLPVQQGALVTRVVPGSAADAAGLQAGERVVALGEQTLPIDGDIIIEFNGNPVLDTNDLLTYINDSQVGDEVILTVQRGGERLALPTKLGERP